MFCPRKALSHHRKPVKKIITGFSLTETLVVMAIALILLAATFPIYSHHLAKKKRLHAEVTLQRVSSALEEYFVVNYSYKNFHIDNATLEKALAQSQYRIAIHATDGHFRITATPYGTQASLDADCGALSLTEKGERLISGSGNVDQCWVG